jgi:DNA modification methylase
LGETLVERCVKFTTPPGGMVVDPFAGTGTTLRVCKRLGFNCVTTEIDKTYCENIAKENDLARSEYCHRAVWGSEVI